MPTCYECVCPKCNETWDFCQVDDNPITCPFCKEQEVFAYPVQKGAAGWD